MKILYWCGYRNKLKKLPSDGFGGAGGFVSEK